ncbi:MAG: uracil phosphoribosyltransferase [Spirochaetaceae bacterium]|jgi:uracil phosphoribosyltransferase|nr:uracil phosphoribosyltransferase [Spirochaetaceae bacterium]
MSIVNISKENPVGLETLISLCKSDSGVNGLNLRKAHYELGAFLAQRIQKDLSLSEVTVIIMMRAGLSFGLGIADEMEKQGINATLFFHYNDEQWQKEKGNSPSALERPLIIVDAVINTGKGILEFAQRLPKEQPVFFTANVVSEKALNLFGNKNLYTIRVSQHSFIGSKLPAVQKGRGPDTGDRLFRTR